MTDARLRRFALTGGRARPEHELPIEAPITAADGARPDGMMPEHRALLGACDRPQTVVDLSAALGLPIGVVRVLALDLADRGAVRLHLPALAAVPPHRDLQLLEEALDGIANL
jgi:hypothetical protein